MQRHCSFPRVRVLVQRNASNNRRFWRDGISSSSDCRRSHCSLACRFLLHLQGNQEHWKSCLCNSYFPASDVDYSRDSWRHSQGCRNWNQLLPQARSREAEESRSLDPSWFTSSFQLRQRSRCTNFHGIVQ